MKPLVAFPLRTAYNTFILDNYKLFLRKGGVRMQYNLDFLFVALIMLLMMCAHFFSYSRKRIVADRMFRFYLMAATADVALDICTCVAISRADPSMRYVNTVLQQGFYLLQIIIPWSFIVYLQTIRKKGDIRGRLVQFCSVPMAFLVLLVLTDPLTRLMFWFDESGVYRKGPLYLLLYLYAAIYVIVAAVYSVVSREMYGKKQVLIILGYTCIGGAGVIYQALHTDVMTTGLGLALGMLLMYLTVSNPSRFTDYLTGAFHAHALTLCLQQQITYRKRTYLVAVDLYRLNRINQVWSIETGNAILAETAKAMKQAMNSERVFRMAGRRFIGIVDSKEKA